MEARTDNLTRRKLDKVLLQLSIVGGASQSLDSEEDIRQSITLRIIWENFLKSQTHQFKLPTLIC